MIFSKKHVVITGGSSGIGRATALQFSEQGAHVFVLDRQEDIKRQSDDNRYKNIEYIKTDITRLEEITSALKHIKSIDHLFANAGIHHVGNIEDTAVEDFKKIMDINVGGVFFTLKSIIPIMKKQAHGGTIVLMGSDQSLIGKSNSAAYGCSKAAVAQLTKSTAIDYAPYNIRVNCVCPGSINTPLLNKAVALFSDKTGKNKETIMKELESAQLFPRLGKPSDVASLVLFLSSPAASFITGSLHSIDGGYTAGFDRIT